MKFIKNIFNKSEEISDEEQEKLNNMLNSKEAEDEYYIDSDEYIYQDEENSSSIEENIIEKTEELDLEEIVKKIRPEQINKLRNLLDRKEKEFETTLGIVKKEDFQIQEEPVEIEKNETTSTQKDAIGELKTFEKEDIEAENEKSETEDFQSEEDTDSVEETSDEKEDEYTYSENEDNNEKEEEYQELDETHIKSGFGSNEGLVDETKALFSKENVSAEISTQSEHDMLNGKEFTHISISYSFNDKDTSEQNSWFISNIKKLEELKNFKILKSEQGIKDLVWEKEESVLISYRVVEK